MPGAIGEGREQDAHPAKGSGYTDEHPEQQQDQEEVKEKRLIYTAAQPVLVSSSAREAS